jgi:hydrogenase expression/formation protein HypE
MSVANEGRLVAFVPPEGVDAAMNAMHVHDPSRDACIIGSVVDEHLGVVVAKTPFGASRVVDVPLGEQLPRIF